MAKTKQTTKRGRKALPVLGVAGVSFALASGSSASTVATTTDTPSQNTTPQIFLGEEEISDVSLATFYVFDKENTAKPQAGQQLAWWRCGCGGCGCAWRGCGGCGGCGGCCWSWGRCRAC
jgi:hypothetical protein